ncbi:hypothetical protein P7K49_002080 [Saguinus oedipus]|uniref:Protein transport protein sec16 n=1 Tax=Saguinus oedipus TaxID=9490 RepID=A0ABQ9WGD4_SAGOE|nr:hypothetical protein P7K49_002080 [Saguinus oedipus]
MALSQSVLPRGRAYQDRPTLSLRLQFGLRPESWPGCPSVCLQRDSADTHVQALGAPSEFAFVKLKELGNGPGTRSAGAAKPQDGVTRALQELSRLSSRPTSPEKFSVPHVCARFGPGGQLIKVIPNLPSEGQPALVEVHSMEALLQHTSEQEEMRAFPGPLGKDDTHKVDVINFAQNKAMKCLQNENLIDKESASLLWNFIVLLCRQNGSVSSCCFVSSWECSASLRSWTGSVCPAAVHPSGWVRKGRKHVVGLRGGFGPALPAFGDLQVRRGLGWDFVPMAVSPVLTGEPSCSSRLKQTVVGTDIAELLLRDHRTVWLPGKSPNEANLIDFTNEAVEQVEEEESGEAQLSFLTGGPTATASSLERETERFRELLLYGRKKVCPRCGACPLGRAWWGDALSRGTQPLRSTHAAYDASGLAVPEQRWTLPGAPSFWSVHERRRGILTEPGSSTQPRIYWVLGGCPEPVRDAVCGKAATRRADALESAMKNGLWGHALLLASKMDNWTHARVMTRYSPMVARPSREPCWLPAVCGVCALGADGSHVALFSHTSSGFLDLQASLGHIAELKNLPINDPLQTVYQLMSGRMPAASTSCGDEKWGDWRPHLAMVLSNLNNNVDIESRTMATMGDTLGRSGRRQVLGVVHGVLEARLSVALAGITRTRPSWSSWRLERLLCASLTSASIPSH